MTMYLFGAGTVIAKRTDIANAPPAFLGTIQDFEVSIDQSIKTLLGQNRVPVAAGAAELKITGKAKFARIQATTINNMVLGQTLTPNSSLDLSEAEAHTIPANPGPYTVQVTNHATFTGDYGVFYTTTGQELTPVSSGSEATGSYSVNTSTGVYTFAAGDANTAILIYYTYTQSSGNLITIDNTLMGALPSFELVAKQKFTYFGAQKQMVLKLNACVSSKISFPFKNQDFTVQEVDIQALANAANQVGSISLTE